MALNKNAIKIIKTILIILLIGYIITYNISCQKRLEKPKSSNTVNTEFNKSDKSKSENNTDLKDEPAIPAEEMKDDTDSSNQNYYYRGHEYSVTI